MSLKKSSPLSANSMLATCVCVLAALALLQANVSANQIQSKLQSRASNASGSANAPHESTSIAQDVTIECNSDSISVTLSVAALTGGGSGIANSSAMFNGMIYPKGLSKNSSCMVEYDASSARANPNPGFITYSLPLRACNTMSAEVADGVEYYNTVMVQPHKRLVTNQGRGYHVRCKYQTKERTISTNSEQQLSVNLSSSTPAVVGAAQLPTCSMKIYSLEPSADEQDAGNSSKSSGERRKEISAEHVKIGDELQLLISLQDQDVYGMLVTDCLVRDGLNWGEQQLINDAGCPVDEDIMPQFEYSANFTRAHVTFQAHKFPYTASVYYQCNVKLCFRDQNCEAQVPPKCGLDADNALISSQRVRPSSNVPARRSRRWTDAGSVTQSASLGKLHDKARVAAAGRQLSLQVSSALQVGDGAALSDESFSEPSNSALSVESLPVASAQTSADSPDNDATRNETPPPDAPRQDDSKEARRRRNQEQRELCLTYRKIAILISLISLILFCAVLLCFACALMRRKRALKKQQAYDASQQSSLQNSPYLNRGYNRD